MAQIPPPAPASGGYLRSYPPSNKQKNLQGIVNLQVFLFSDSTGGVSVTSHQSPVTRHYIKEVASVTPTTTMETMLISFIRILSEGPEVSLNGSPTVSPVTAAL